jgi:hypothetical protein
MIQDVMWVCACMILNFKRRRYIRIGKKWHMSLLAEYNQNKCFRCWHVQPKVRYIWVCQYILKLYNLSIQHICVSLCGYVVLSIDVPSLYLYFTFFNYVVQDLEVISFASNIGENGLWFSLWKQNMSWSYTSTLF